MKKLEENKEVKKDIKLSKEAEKLVLLLQVFSAVKLKTKDGIPVEIIPNLYLGSIGAFLNKEKLSELGITHVVSALESGNFSSANDLIIKKIPILDSMQVNILDYVEESNQFIKQAIDSGKKVLVHCFAGISRSSSLIIAFSFCQLYLIKYHKKTRTEALQLIQQYRPQAQPNIGQDKFKSITKLYVRGSLGCVVVSDITNQQSLQAAINWKQIILDNCDLLGDSKEIPILLVQNKHDLLEQLDKVEEYMTLDYAKTFAQDSGFIDVIQTSAKENYQLDKIFERLAAEIRSRGLLDNEFNRFSMNKSNVYNRPSALRKDQQQQKIKKSRCC